MVRFWELVVGSGKLDLDPRYENKSLPHLNGINGLSNHHGTCYLNTTLQMLAQTIRLHLEHGDCSENSQNYKMMEAIVEKMPTLMALVNQTPMKDGDLKRLYQEATRAVGEQGMYEFLGGEKITPNQLETGYGTGGISSIYLHTFLYALKVPTINFSVKQDTNYYKKNQIVETNLYQQEASSLNNDFQTNTVLANTIIGEPPSCLNMLITKRSENAQNPIKNILQPIRFFQLPAQDQKKETIDDVETVVPFVSYEPIMISVEPKNVPHTYVFKKQNGSWFEINDDRIFAIPKEWEDDLEKFCNSSVSLITYQNITENITNLDTHAHTEQNPTSQKEQKRLNIEQCKKNKIDFINRIGYSAFGCPESFFVSQTTNKQSQPRC